MLCTLAKPTGGSAPVAGHDVVAERDDVRRQIGLVFQDPTLDGYLTAEQNLRLHAELYGVAARARRRRGCSRCWRWSACRTAATRRCKTFSRRHEAPAGDRARPDALAARAVPRRADDRARPADAQLDLELHPRAARARGDHDLHDHALHGRGRVLRPDRDHGPAARSSRSTRPRRSRRRSAPTASRSRPRTRRRGARGALRRSSADALGGRGRVLRADDGEEFVPRLFAELGVPIRRSACRGPASTTCSCPTPARRSATPRSRAEQRTASIMRR